MGRTLVNVLTAGLAMITLSFSTSAAAAEPKIWTQFKTAKQKSTEPTLPDFSYAGYDYGESPLPSTSHWRVFNVRDYGAVPDDGRFDDQGIQAAIDAAEQHTANVDPTDLSEGAIVQFEKGRYKVGPKQGLHPEQQITIQGNNIVLRGAGSDSKNGTVLFIQNHMARDKYCGNDGGRNHCTGIPMFEVSPSVSPRGVGSPLVGTFKRETSTLEVEDSNGFFPGQRVAVFLRGSPDLTSAQFGNRTPHRDWTRINKGMAAREFTTIKSINGNKITLRAPVHITVKDSYKDDNGRGANLVNTAAVENVGVENIQFMGNWGSIKEKFIHHKGSKPNQVDDPVHDYGWTALRLTKVFNGWLRRVEFRDLNQSLFIKESSAVTVTNIAFRGKQGHTSINLLNSTNVLVKDSQDTARHLHGIGISQRTAGSVFLRYKMGGKQNIDFHGDGSYATLHDNISGGHFWGNGGNTSSFPHHMQYYVTWNFNVNGGPKKYDFWPSDGHNAHVFFRPYFIGLHGKKVDLKASTIAANQSQGKRVEPYSLYEAQLGLRLLPGYTLCCKEGSEKTFNRPVDIAFGAQGTYNIKRNVTGKVTFNAATFGDPVPGQVKSVYYRPAAQANPVGPAGFSYAADEGENVDASSLQNVAYGANGDFVTKYNRTSAIDCTNDAFGSDPAPRVKKACFVKAISTPAGYTEAANERQTVNVQGTMNVAFGAQGQYIWKTQLTSNIACTRDAFGGDPKPGVAKKCYTRVVSTSGASDNAISSSASNGGDSSSCNGTRDVALESRVELDLNSANCVEFASDLSGRSLQVWDSDSNSSCNFRGTIESENGTGNLTVDANYEISTSFTGRTVKFNPTNGCRFLQVRSF